MNYPLDHVTLSELQFEPVLFGLNARQLAEHLESNPASLARLTPQAIRGLSNDRPHCARVLGESFNSLSRQASSDGPTRPREGFGRELTDAQWFTRMANIAGLCERFDPLQFDKDELGYETEVARLCAIVERQDIARRATKAHEPMSPIHPTQAMQRIQEVVEIAALPVSPSISAAPRNSFPASDPGTVMCAAGARSEVASEWSPASPLRSRASVRLSPVHTGSMVISNLFTRCALGTIGRRGTLSANRPLYTPDEPLCITRVSGFKPTELVVSYSGQQLGVGELETWSALLKLASPANLGGRVQFWSTDVLTLLRRGTGGSARRTLREEIGRLQGGVVTMRTTLEPVKRLFKDMFPDDPIVNDRRFASASHPIEVSFGLLGPSSTNGARWSVVVPREVALAFSEQMQTWFKLERYFSVKTDTARRLFLFYVSHPNPWPFTLRELSEFVGSGMSRTNDLMRQMLTAHKELQSAGVVKSWRYGPSERRALAEPVFEIVLSRQDMTDRVNSHLLNR